MGRFTYLAADAVNPHGAAAGDVLRALRLRLNDSDVVVTKLALVERGGERGHRQRRAAHRRGASRSVVDEVASLHHELPPIGTEFTEYLLRGWRV